MKEYLKNLFEYENWANREITDCLLKMEDPPEKVMSLISHIINARIIWLERIKNISQSAAVWQVYNKSELMETLNKSASRLMEFMSKIEDKDLETVIEYTNTKGEKHSSTVKDILTHLLFHSPYHRGQIVLLIKPLVPVLPYTDYIHFARNIRK